MSASTLPVSTPLFEPDPLLRDLLAVSLTAINLLRPCYGPTGELIDFAPEYFNPAAQRMTGLPERPTGTARTLFPDIFTNGIFAFYRQVFETGEPDNFQRYYQADGLDNYFHIAARRSGEWLWVSFTDTADQSRTAAENALRASQTREQDARVEAEQQQALLYRVFEQAPAMICILQGPQHVFEFVNPPYQALVGARPLLGRPFAEAFPELAGQGIFEPLDELYRTGEPFYANEQLTQIDHTNTGPAELEERYYNFVWQARRDRAGAVDGVLVFAYDVTPQVLARRQVEHLSQVAEAARAEAEAGRQRLTQTLLRMPANIALLRGPEHVYDFVNPAYERLFPGRRLLGRPLREVIPELEGQGYYELLDQMYETGEPFYQDEAAAWADFAGTGELQRRYYRAAFEPIRDRQGQVTEVLSFAMDVTAQVEARQQVEQLEAARAEVERERAQLQALLTQAPVAIALLQGEDLRVVSANDLIAELWGYTPADVVGRPLMEAVPEAQGQGFDDLMREVMRTQVPFIGKETAAVMLRHGQLQTSYFNYVYQPQVDAEGQGQGLIIVATDMTEQVRSRQQNEHLNAELEARVQQRTQAAEQAQAEAERQRQSVTDLVAQAPAALCVVGGPDFTYEAFNPLYAAMFGGRPRLGRPMGEVLPEVVNHPGFLAFRAVYAEGRTIRESEVLVPLARPGDGVLEDHYFSYTQQPRYDSQGQIDGVFVFAVEVTDQVHARQQVQALNQALTTTNADLHQSNTQLTRTNVDLDNFIYTASHDLKAPITNIEGLLLALEHELPAAARTGDVSLMLTMMQDATERFRRTIDHLTDLSRLQKEHNPARDAVALAAVVEAVRLDITPLLTQTQGQLTVSIPAGLTVTFAEKNLRSVVYNLLSNAFKYHHPDRVPDVQLRSWLADDYAVLEVQDNGLGLDLSQGQDKLFAMFQRLHTHVEGTGVGLYMVKRILENAGGRIEVTSELGQGSMFRVYFQR